MSVSDAALEQVEPRDRTVDVPTFPDADDLLAIRELSIEFLTAAGRTAAVDKLFLRVPAGRTVALVGESGSGKSVTAQAILGILPRAARVTSGSIRFAEPGKPPVDLAALDPFAEDFRRIRGDRIAMIFQEPMTSFSPLHTIGNQIGEAHEIHKGGDRATVRELTLETLRLVGFPDPAAAYRAYPFELSGGLRQRAMIAMALICRPALLIADEPTTALDVTLQAQILKLVRDLQAELGMAVLLITHDLGVVANLAEELVVMHHGRVVESGMLRDLFARPTHPYFKALLNAVPDMAQGPRRRLTPIREIKLPREALFAPPGGQPAGEPILTLEAVEKSYTLTRDRRLFSTAPAVRTRVLKGVDLMLRRGECLGLVGESGCGKTTLSRAIMRSVDIDSGRILLSDNRGGTIDLAKLGRAELVPVRRRIQYVFQDPYSALDPRMTVAQILAEPLEVQGIGTQPERKARVKRLVEAVGLGPEHLNRYPHSFSGGQRQRIGIARALALEPEIVICDEPVAALDVSVQAQVLNLLGDLQRSSGITYLFISHNLAVINYVADRIAVMWNGSIVEIAPRAALFGRPMHPYTRLLMSAVPDIDPARPLDFDGLGAARDLADGDWPAPFNKVDGVAPSLIEVGEGHFVRASRLP